MGKAGRWLRNFFLPGRKGRWKANDRADTDCQSVLSAPLPAPAATSSVREKRRWSFRRPGSAAGKADAGASGGQGPQGPLASSSSHCFSEAAVHVVVVQDDQRAAAEVVNAAAPVASLPPLAPARGCEDEEAAAAIKIQSAYRSYLARKALCALRGMVKLQAMVRGQLVRRQAKVTLRRMQALVDAQRRARADRLRLLEEEDARQQLANTNANATPRQPPSRRSPLHPLSRKPLEALENVKIVEVDDAGVAQGGRRSSFCSTTPGRTPAKAAELYQKVSPTPSALTDASARTLSGRFDDASLSSAWESARRGNAAWRADHRAPAAFAAAASPSYMANTKSSRAKARRSQSAPRQRPSSSASGSAAAASPSPSWCEPRPPSPGGSGGARHRASLDLPGAPRSSAGRMERCASRARASVGDGASLPSSECGSSGTVGHRGSAQGAWHG
ncbi:uncharacterized protein LOC120700055 [Panicum virgatum]|uniref:DUF4005 domain-containing protein n=1 Tax=Panicum virgatum TaxID=38727 RepID=A0A8T0VCP3_PANVG|nr:uncharacterized protein LOC120700055 [Panicum virgatum]KAG2630573.1 hypothetical protein PVAP13_3KG533900 [Panicum virgatum]